jgi:hypothetical protein
MVDLSRALLSRGRGARPRACRLGAVGPGARAAAIGVLRGARCSSSLAPHRREKAPGLRVSPVSEAEDQSCPASDPLHRHPWALAARLGHPRDHNASKQPRCTTCGATPGTGPIHAAQPLPTVSAAPVVEQAASAAGPPDPTLGMTTEPAAVEPSAGCRQCGAEFKSWEEGLDHAASTHDLDRDSPEAAASIHRY